MFNGAKPAFGQTSTSTGFAFSNTATASPFGQTSFGKPQGSGFGQPAFGQQNTSLFGSNQPTTSLFGTNTSSGFGSAAPAQQAFGGFSQPQNTSLFGTTQQNATQPSLFGQPTTSAFGASKPSGFGFGQVQPATSLFGQASTANTSGTGFGAFGQTTTTSNVFGNPATSFGQTANAGATGTAVVKYQPSIGTDTLLKNGQQNNVNTKQHCITAMKEYEGKSLEELRMEDYLVNRKGPQTGSTSLFGQTQPATAGLFGSTGTQQTTGIFGQQTENKNLFATTNTLGATGFGGGTSAFGPTSQASTGFFPKPFSAPSTSSTGFGFGGTDNTNNPFGAKTFGQTGSTGLFGQTTQTTAPAFGQTQTGFGGFGTPNQQPSLFGTTNTDNKSSFGLPATSNAGFGSFGTNTNTNVSTGALFGNKPATGFGTNTAFGTTTSTAGGFGGFGTANTGGSLFNNTLNKPAASAFGSFGTQQSTQPLGGLNFGTANQPLFGNNAAKPGLFGNTSTPGTNLFGTTTAFNTSNPLGGFGTNQLGGNTGLGVAQKPPAVQIHQQILAMATSPYGDNPIFKDFRSTKADETDSLKPTNPAAQKALLDSASKQFKVSSKTGNNVKVKPVGNILTKKSLFEGLEEYDNSVEESFNLKRNPKRLLITLKSDLNSSTGSGSANNSNNNNEIKRSSVTPQSTDFNDSNAFNGNAEEILQQVVPSTSKPKDGDDTGRESWLNPNALEKMRRQNQGLSETIQDNTLSELVPRKSGNENSLAAISISKHREELASDDKFSSTPDNANLSNTSRDEENESLNNISNHPTGIILRRKGYYTIPTLDELVSYLSEDGTCIVPNFTVGREGYGNVFFNKPIDVYGLNLDEIVHFRHKEVNLYPDDDNKPPVGCELNREAQVTLDQVWPHDKTIHEPIKDPERLAAMNYEATLRRTCDKLDIRFIEYRPETGSWVFKVKHFSKYGLNDSDEEENIPTDPKKLKMTSKIDESKLKDKIADKQIKPENKQLGEQYKNDMQNSSRGDIQIVQQFDLKSDLANSLVGFNLMNSTSPTTELARDAGTDSHKLQLMKASFFIDEEFDSKSVISENLIGRESPDQMVPTKSSLKNYGLYSSSQSLSNDGFGGANNFPSSPLTLVKGDAKSESELEVDEDNIPLNFPPLILKPKVASVKIDKSHIAFKDSIGYSLRGKCISDLGLYNCNYFKVGFGSKNIFHCLNINNKAIQPPQETNIFRDSLKSDQSYTVLKAIKISCETPTKEFESTITGHLEIQLAHSLRVEVDDSDCPYIQSGGKDKLINKHYDESKNFEKFGSYEEYCVSVWSLLQALWSNQEDLDGQSANSHFAITYRKNSFTEWLEETLIQKNVSSEEISKKDYLNHIFNLLMCHRVIEACEIAFKNDDANLSLLLAQLSSGPVIRQLIQHQLSLWQKIEADNFIEIERLKLLMLVGGVPLMSCSQGPINIFEGVYWLKALAIQLWYLCSPTASITDALISYEESFNCDEFYALPPAPPHAEKYRVKSSKPMYDLRYHILQLFSKRSYPLESLLNPATHTSDPMDFRLSWLLLQTLESLGYRHCSELAECHLHTSFANQLENAGLWEWSIFVLLHIKDKNRRELCVQEVLYRYITIGGSNETSEKEKFVVNSLGIPQKWIDWAKAVKAGALKNYHLQAKYLLKAMQWSQAHTVIMQHIAPDAIINENFDYLRELLYEFEDSKSKKVMRVPSWTVEGQILLDFFEIHEKFERLKALHQGDIETRWESLKPQLIDLCSRINLFPCPTAKHRLCQSEIAQSLACLLRGILLTCPVLNPCQLIKIALEKLPLPQEFAQQELRILINTLVADTLQGTAAAED